MLLECANRKTDSRLQTTRGRGSGEWEIKLLIRNSIIYGYKKLLWHYGKVLKLGRAGICTALGIQ